MMPRLFISGNDAWKVALFTVFKFLTSKHFYVKQQQQQQQEVDDEEDALESLQLLAVIHFLTASVVSDANKKKLQKILKLSQAINKNSILKEITKLSKPSKFLLLLALLLYCILVVVTLNAFSC